MRHLKKTVCCEPCRQLLKKRQELRIYLFRVNASKCLSRESGGPSEAGLGANSKVMEIQEPLCSRGFFLRIHGKIHNRAGLNSR